MVWNQYDDHRVYKLIGPNEPTDAKKALLDRYIAFLESALEYEWPLSDFMSIGQVGHFLNALSFGAINAHLAQTRNGELQRMATAGDMRYWPFRSASEIQTGSIG